ncbi:MULTISPECIES: mitofilin family membrane protein [unclassified Sinorhizobium]|uniref:COG4223 family protein n=1 Tax=unclassified Sinorhizobium TaxID=2613772 RepID=UPI0024C31404|nr:MULTISPECIES: mitofilin family membrane protein [unclassified Sinorhizobium]MDK1377207.1 mitofilin family membrane protein [Sinorhizobium sp. 6-70]MDK1478826.1 mitofilin family membrane protein [Sinorhizobium sp. 6-117]
MVSENPPRRSKSEKEPLTIDLQAEKTAAGEAESVADQEPVTDKPAEFSADQAESENAADTADAKEQTEDERADAAAAAFDEEPPHLSEETMVQPAQQRQATSAGALAAGILGGLVALLGAGVLQYAGYIPALGPDRGNAALDHGLASEIEAIKAQIASQSAPANIAPLESRLAALEQAAKEPGGAGAPQITALEADVANLTKEIAGLKASLADAEQSAAAAKAELAGRIDQAEQKLNEPVNDIEMAKAVAVTALKTAIDRGGPFLAELGALRSIAPDDATVKDLAQDAATGVATRTDLRAAFPQTADAMLDRLNQPDPNEGIFARLVSSAMSGIRIRPVGSVEGDTPEAVIARIEDKLNNGDLKGASLEWGGLPEPAKSAGAEFKAKLDQRLRVETAIDAAVAQTMTRTGTAG